jgi:hypothetical protein
MKTTKEEQLMTLRFEEIMLSGKLIDICLTYGNPRTNKVFKIEKRMDMEELFATHAEQMPAALISAYKKLCQMREVLKANHIDVGTI